MKAYLLRHFYLLKTTRRHRVRKTIGVLLVIGGLLGFLPVLGYWMLPLGLALLAVDFASVRRFNRRTLVWWGRRRQQWRRNGRTRENHAGSYDQTDRR